MSAADYLLDALARGNAQGDGYYTRRCTALIKAQIDVAHAWLTPSCTSSLEIACMALGLKPGDQVILPAFTFPSAANAIVRCGAVPVFVDISPDDLNVTPKAVQDAVTSATRAVIVTHYAGVPCDVGDIRLALGESPNRVGRIAIIEDAAQAYGSSSNGKMAGALGDIGCFSFHATKNIECGEGGAIVTNDDALAMRIEIAREKGTDRSAFLRRAVRRYSWVGLGTSGLPSEYQAAVLLDRLERAVAINCARRLLWDVYDISLGDLRAPLQRWGGAPPPEWHNGHIFWIDCLSYATREALRSRIPGSTSHFEPLHLSPAGARWGRAPNPLKSATEMPDRILRLPLDHTSTLESIRMTLKQTHDAILLGGLGDTGDRLAGHLAGA